MSEENEKNWRPVARINLPCDAEMLTGIIDLVVRFDRAEREPHLGRDIKVVGDLDLETEEFYVEILKLEEAE